MDSDATRTWKASVPRHRMGLLCAAGLDQVVVSFGADLPGRLITALGAFNLGAVTGRILEKRLR